MIVSHGRETDSRLHFAVGFEKGEARAVMNRIYPHRVQTWQK